MRLPDNCNFVNKAVDAFLLRFARGLVDFSFVVVLSVLCGFFGVKTKVVIVVWVEKSKVDYIKKMIKMPNWLNKPTFSPKKTPTRKATASLATKDLSPKRIEKELGPNVGEIRICLGDQQAVFDGGLWVPESGKVGGTFKENEKLKKEVKKLEEENHLLKIKFELVLDMLTQATAEANLNREELEKLRSKLYTGKRVTTGFN